MMYLTKDEEHILDGEYGWAKQVSLKILVRLGELYNATKLIPIRSAHVSGVSYKTLGDAPVEFLRAMANSGGRVKVKSTLNPQSFDPEYLTGLLPEGIRRNQLNILEQFKKMGLTMSLTCTPYYLENTRQDSHLAWAESSAVVYANSILGAWTNREGGPSALASAIIGKTPNYGMHQAENRQPHVLVDVRTPLQSEAEFGALGIYLGHILEDKIPLIQGLKNPSETELKQLGAALATTGMVNMFHHNMEPETADMEKITVEQQNLERTVKSLSTSPNTKPDLVFIGCPHCSLNEIRRISTLMDDKKVSKETEFWICTSRHVKKKSGKYVDRIERRGGHVLTDMCTIVSWTERLKINSIMTNSAKTAYYAPTLNKAGTALAPTKQCLITALQG